MKNNYMREIKPGVWVDVYDVIEAWKVTCPALQHVVKKVLQPGERGHKSIAEDLSDIVASGERAVELQKTRDYSKGGSISPPVPSYISEDGTLQLSIRNGTLFFFNMTGNCIASVNIVIDVILPHELKSDSITNRFILYDSFIEILNIDGDHITTVRNIDMSLFTNS